MSIRVMSRMSDIQAAIAVEASADDQFKKLVRQALESARPIAHWGDGNAGYLMQLFVDELHAFGYMKPVAQKAKKAKKKISGRLRTAVFERDGYRCVKCGSHTALCVDHIYPESLGGTLAMENLQTLCAPCNSAKGAKTPDEWKGK